MKSGYTLGTIGQALAQGKRSAGGKFCVGERVMAEFDVAEVIAVLPGDPLLYLVEWPNGEQKTFREDDFSLGSMWEHTSWYTGVR